MLRSLFIVLSASILSYAATTVCVTEDNIILVDGKPFFPLGVYFETEQNQWHPDGYGELQEAGFNLINLMQETSALLSHANSYDIISNNEIPQDPCFGNHTYSNPANCNRILSLANNHNLLIIADNAPFWSDGNYYSNFCLGFPITQSLRESWVDNVVNWAANDDAFLGWCSLDEPVWSLSPYNNSTLQARYNLLKDMYDIVKEKDPNHIIHMNFAGAHPTEFSPYNWSDEEARAQYVEDLQLYSKAADIISVDIYPLRQFSGGGQENYRLFDNCDISLIGDYTKLLVNDVVQNQKPVWIVLEASSRMGKDNRDQVYEGHIAGEPYPYEFFRFEAYDAIVHGARGLIWYGWHDVGKDEAHADTWDDYIEWNHVKNLVKNELRILCPVFAAIAWDTSTSMKVNSGNVWRKGLGYVDSIRWDVTPSSSPIYGELALFHDPGKKSSDEGGYHYLNFVNRHCKPEDTVNVKFYISKDTFPDDREWWVIDILANRGQKLGDAGDHWEFDTWLLGDILPGQGRLYVFVDQNTNELAGRIMKVRNERIEDEICSPYDTTCEKWFKKYEDYQEYIICLPICLNPDTSQCGCLCGIYLDLKTIDMKGTVLTSSDSSSNDIDHIDLFLSRDGGATFPETLALNFHLIDSVRVETVMVDSVEKIRITRFGTYKDTIPYIPSSDCKALLVLYDKEGNSASTMSESWEVPLISFSPQATAWNNRPMSRDNGEFHILYHTLLPHFSCPDMNSALLYAHTSDTKPWEIENKALAGISPSVSEDAGAWISSDNTILYFSLREADEWSDPLPIKYADESVDEKFSPPAISLDGDTVHISYISVIPQQGFYLHRLYYLKFYKCLPPDSIISELVDVWAGDGDIDYGPSLVLDYQNRPVVGVKGRYLFKTESGWQTEELPDSLTIPSLASYGGNVYLLYSIGNTLIRRYGYSGDYWLGEDTVANLSNLQAFEISKGQGIIWQDGDGIGLKFWDPVSKNYSPTHILGNGTYPHTLVYRDSINLAFSIFTQADSEKVGYRFTQNPYDLAYYYLELGREEPSPFTMYREGFTDDMDTGDSLVYYFPKLDSSEAYRVLMELFSASPETVEIFIDGDSTEVELPGGEVLSIERGIPLGSKDIWIEIKGEDIGCKRIIIYPGTTIGYGYGGPQEAIIKRPKIFKLYQSYPNPTTKTAVIRFQIPVKTSVSLKIYDVTGRLVRTLTRAQSLEPGVYTVVWDGRSDRGLRVPAGVYFYRLKTEEYRATKKLVMIR